MPQIVEYKGERHEFPDGWSEEKIAEALSAGQVTPAQDVARNAPSAIARGVAGLMGLPGDVSRGMRWLNDKAMQKFMGREADPQYVETGRPKGLPESTVPQIVPDFPTSGDVVGGIESVTGPLYKPQTRAGKYSGAVLEFLPGAIGPGGLVRNAARYAVAPGLASEAAGQATEGTAAEPYARFAGGLAGLGAARMLSNPDAGAQAVSQSLRNVTQQQIDDAGRLMADARVRGVDLTWPEAIDQVTDGATNLGNLQRVVEGSQRGSEVMRPFMAQRPGQIERSFANQMGDIVPVQMTPSSVGPRASEAATGILDGIRRRINARTEPDYRAAAADTVPDRTLQRLHRSVPGFTEALATVRGNPHLNDPIRALPDNSVAVLNEVKKQLDTMAANVGRATDPNRNMQIAASAERSATAVRRAGRRASTPYRRALDEQARAREAELRPQQEGIIGQISNAGDTAAAGRALLPEGPLPGSAAETGRATRLMNTQNSQVTRNLVRSRLESLFNKAARDLQGGPSEFAGAAARARIYGDRQMRRNIRAALSELPNGNQLATGFERLMEVYQATGRRQRIGSQTAFNQEYQAQMRGGRVLGEGLTGARRAIRERYQQWRLGQNMDELARLFTDQGAQRRLLELSQMRYGDPRIPVVAGQLAEEMLLESQ